MKLKIALFLLFCMIMPTQSYAKARQGIVTIKINIAPQKESGNVKLWLPYPLSDEYQRIENIKIEGNFNKSPAVYREPVSGSVYLFSEWEDVVEEKILEFSFEAKAEERLEERLFDKYKLKDLNNVELTVPVEIKNFLESTWWIPSDGEIKELADKITEGRKGILEKSKAVYDWVVQNTFRDPSVKGCGLGIVQETLTKRSGKCADISSVYVALARAAGVPAREVFGLRLGKEPEQDITEGYHCWAEFYLPGTGWVQVDPADVRKIMLSKGLTLEQAEEFNKYYFGAVDEYRIVLERGGRGIVFYPSQSSGPLNYFMYPYAEVDGEPLDYFDAEGFSYTVNFKVL